MPCYHPLVAIRTFDEKKPVKILGSNINYFNNAGKDYCVVDNSTGEVAEVFRVPCGKCVGCRLDYSRSWADRCVMEGLLYPESDNCWITLTYSDDNLPIGEKELPTLFSDDLSAFNKRLRTEYERRYGHIGIRFYGAGEYGDTTLRPHYHVIYFNLPIYDKYQIGTTHDGFPLYNSPLIDDLWGKGFAVIAENNWSTCAYTARYVMKKQKGKNAQEFYNELGISPEFVRMSRRPGIASEFYDKYVDKIYKNDEIILPSVNGKEHIITPPRFFDLKLKNDNPVLLNLIKSRRQKIAEQARINKISMTDLDEEQFNLMSERIHTRKVSALKRNL